MRQRHWATGLWIVWLVTTAQAGPLDALSKQIEAMKPDEALTVLDQQQTQIANWPAKDQGGYYRLRAQQRENLKNISGAREDYARAIQLYRALPDTGAELVNSLLDLGYMDYLIHYRAEAYCPTYTEALTIARKLHDRPLLAKTLVNNAYCERTENGSYERGIGLLSEALDIAKQDKLTDDVHALVYNASAVLSGQFHLYQQAYDYMRSAHQHFERMGQAQSMFNAQHSLFSYALQLGDQALARRHLDAMSDMVTKHPDQPDFAFFAALNRGSYHFMLGEDDAAKQYLALAAGHAGKTSERYFVRLLYAFQTILHYSLGETRRARDTLALYNAVQLPSPDPDYADLITAISQQMRGESEHAAQGMVREWRKLHSKKLRDARLQRENTAKGFDQRLDRYERQLLQTRLKISELEREKLSSEGVQTRLVAALAVLMAVLFAILSVWLYRARNLFRRSAQVDALTGIANRRHVFEVGESMLALARLRKAPLAVVYLDIDHFKAINDRYGHQVGDEAIRLVVKQAQQSLRRQDLIGRIGGEEFVILLPFATERDAEDIAERVRRNIESQPLAIAGHTISLTVSLGIAVLHKKSHTLSDLLKRADDALYQAKQSGRNRWIRHLDGTTVMGSIDDPPEGGRGQAH